MLEFDTPLASQHATRVFGQGGDFSAKVCSAGGGGGPLPNAAGLCFPTGVATDSANRLYIADGGELRVLAFETPLASQSADRVLGQRDFLHDGFNNLDGTGMFEPQGVAVDGAGHLYVADVENNRVLGYLRAASFTNGAAADLVLGQSDFRSSLCDSGTAPADVFGVDSDTLCLPSGVAADPNNNLYVADALNNRVLEYNSPFGACGSFPCVGGPANLVFGQGGLFTTGACTTSATGLCDPSNVAVDSAGHLYVADSTNNRVLEYNTPLTNQTANLVFGQAASFDTKVCSNGHSGNPAPSAAGLCQPLGIAVDGAGRLYIADDSNNRVLEFDNPLSSQTANRVFGQGANFATISCSDGLGGNPAPSADGLCEPDGVAVDGAGRLYIAESTNDRVLEFDSPLTSQTANLVFGQDNNFTTRVCSNGTEGLCSPKGVAVDSATNLYVADSGNNRVLEYDQPRAVPTTTATATPTATPTATVTPTSTPTATATATATATPTPVPVTLKITPKALKFSKTTVGTRSKPKTVKVSNPKGSKKHPGLPVLIEMISDPAVFTETNTCSSSLAAGSSCTIAVTFTPSAAGAQTGTLMITDNANRSMQTLQLSGTGK